MTKNIKLIAAFILILIVSIASVSLYRSYRKSHGVYVETIKQENGWGYKIYVQGKLMVNQYVMPAIPGNKAFPCEEAARKTADLVVEKVGRREMPTVTPQEVNKILEENCK